MASEMVTTIAGGCTSNVCKLPVVKKRGRKVSKGPVADVHRIHGQDLPERPTERAPVCNRVEAGEDRLAYLIAERIKRSKLEKLEYEAFLDASPTIRRFPESRRHRSLNEVEEHRRAFLGETETAHWTDEAAERIAAKAKALVDTDGGEA